MIESDGRDVTSRVGHVSELFRYPIKSVGGEKVSRFHINERGVEGDRLWAVENEEGKFGSGKTTRRFRRVEGLLEFRSYYLEGCDIPVLVLPDGSEHPATSLEARDALVRQTGKTVEVTAEREISHFDEGAVHVLSTSSLQLLSELHGAAVDVRRLRNNITLKTSSVASHLEADWLGRQLTIGPDVVLEIFRLMPRCVMVNMKQYGLDEDHDVLKSVAKLSPDICLGAVARVLQTGLVSVGDKAYVR